MWDPGRKSRRARRLALRRQLVHAAGCCVREHGCACFVRERFNYDHSWPGQVDSLGVSVPRSLRQLYRLMKDTPE